VSKGDSNSRWFVLLVGIVATAVTASEALGRLRLPRATKTLRPGVSVLKGSGPSPIITKYSAAWPAAGGANAKPRSARAPARRSQRGWELYEPLIANLIGAPDGPGTKRFAPALAKWQRTHGITPTGILNDATWMEMVSTFQSRRIKDRSHPARERLLIAPIADCFDQERPEELRLVEREAYAAYKRMIKAAAADRSLRLSATAHGDLAPDERFLKIISAYRTSEYQAELRKRSPRSGRAGLAINSPHFTGRALDLYVGGEPVSTRDGNRAVQTRTPVYRWLVRNAARFGFHPYFYEPWHWEYVGKD